MTNDVAVRDSVVGSLAQTIDDVLTPLIPPGTRCALLDCPNHANVGDSAIWLGETEWLGRNGAEVVYVCDLEDYSQARLAARLGEGTILLHGGGNLGDFWGEHQEFRERVIRDFPEHRIVQLPQTIYFMDRWGVGEARRVFNAHRRLILLCRDQTSLEFARTEFSAPCRLCPDMAFAMGHLKRPAPDTEILWLARTDAESQGMSLPEATDVICTDWLDEPPTPLRDRYRSLNRHDEADSLKCTCDALARERVERGCRLLGRGKVVVTDRLHGHILCLFLGIPHVVLDNNYGKVRGFHQTWTRGNPLARWATSTNEALAIARRAIAKEQ